MKIDHIAIWVADIEVMRSFYMKYFGATCGQLYVNKKKGFSSYFLSFQGGTRIEIMNRNDISEYQHDGDSSYGLTHLAISAENKQEVDFLTETLRQDGYKVIGEPRITGDGYYESVILDPEGNQIEITEQII